MDVNLIAGPPGTGKTTYLMNILEKELKTYKPSEIAFVSFTKEGAEQGRKRAISKFHYKIADFPYFRTLHSLAFQSLKLKRTSVISKENYYYFAKKMGMNFIGYYSEELSSNDDQYLFWDELYRNNPTTAATYLSRLDVKKLEYIRVNYKKFKDTFAILDYTDMIERFVKRAKAVPVKIAIIDEAQDNTTLQWKMIWTAFKHCDKIYIAFDDDQSIYQWSGADVNYLLSIKGGLTILDKSYRLPDAILNYSKRITSMIKKRVDKVYIGTGAEGKVYQHNILDSVEINPNETYFFLSRNNIFLKDVEDYLIKKGLMYKRKGKASISADDVKAINTYESVRKTRMMNDAIELSLSPYVKKDYSLEAPWYESFKWPKDKCNYVRDLIMNKTNIKDIKINVGTIHSVKGGEADNVVLLLDVTKNVQNNIDVNPDSEHRVFYVGVTRAKKNLHIIHSHTKYAYEII